ncbi:MAG TPA: RodZ domain-containing protein [Solirubrobacterales bacterium]
METTGIGNTLRDARNRRKIDLSEVEDATKIRVRFLSALENEDWDVLPGDIYTRAFIRTYASYLGLDGERLAEDYRASTEGAGGADRPPARVEPALSARSAPGRSGVGGRILIVLVVAALIGIVVAIGLAGGGGNSSGKKSNAAAKKSHSQGATTKAAVPGIGVSLEATDEVWVCLLDADEKPVIDGEILAAGERRGPFHSKGFSVAFGNGSVEMEIDGSPAHLPESSSPIGFAVDEKGHLSELQEGERPECA